MSRYGQMPRLLACAGLATLVALGCEAQDEPCFEMTGTLATVTADTLGDRHLEGAFTPDGTQMVFTTDYWGLLDAQDERRDVAIIDVPAPDDPFRTPDRQLTDFGNAKPLFWGLLSLPESPSTIEDLDLRRKAQPNVHPDGTTVAAVININIGFAQVDRIFFATMEFGSQTSQALPVSNITMLDDVNLGTNSNDEWYRYRTPVFHPDPASGWIAYTRWYERPGDPNQGRPDSTQAQAIFAFNRNDGRTVQVTPSASAETNPAWSPDGTSIAFESRRSGVLEVYTIGFDPDAGGPVTSSLVKVTSSTDTSPIQAQSFDPTWTTSGKLVFVSTRRAPCTSFRDRNLWVSNPDGSDLKALVFSRFDDDFPIYNPSGGNSIAFSTGRNQSEDWEGAKMDLWLLNNF